MVITPNTIAELLGLLEGLRHQKEGLTQEREALIREIDAKLAAVDADIAAFERVLGLANQDPPPEVPPAAEPEPPQGQLLLPTATSEANDRSDAPPIPLVDYERLTAPLTVNQWARRLEGLSQPQSLIRIAEESDGYLVLRDVKRIFIATGKAKGKPDNVDSHIYHMVLDSGRFRKVAKGVFKLLPRSGVQSAAKGLFDQAQEVA